MATSSEWEELYQQALLELDDIELQRRIGLAEEAVRRRLLEVRANSISGTRDRVEERHRLEDALYSLQCLRRITPRRSA